MYFFHFVSLRLIEWFPVCRPIPISTVNLGPKSRSRRLVTRQNKNDDDSNTDPHLSVPQKGKKTV